MFTCALFYYMFIKSGLGFTVRSYYEVLQFDPGLCRFLHAIRIMSLFRIREAFLKMRIYASEEIRFI